MDVKLPGAATLRIPGDGWVLGDCFETGQTRGALLDAYHLLIEGEVEITGVGAELRTVRAGKRTLVGSRSAFDAGLVNANLAAAIAARRRWVESLKPATPALRKAFSQMKTMVYAPQGQFQRRFTTPDRWPHRGMWLWDSAFHAIGYRHLDAGLAREILEAVFDGQREDGFVPIRSDPHWSHDRFTQPPVLALAAKLVLESEPNPEWLARVYPKLAAYVKWDIANRDSDGSGLVEWLIEEQVNCRSGESGMDNSTRFDSARVMDATDFNSFLAHECEILATFARQLGRDAEAQEWSAHHARLCRLIEARLWNEKQRFYTDHDSEVLASAGFLPLLCGFPGARGMFARAIAQSGHLRHAVAGAVGGGE
jgi:hypothetical protein